MACDLREDLPNQLLISLIVTEPQHQDLQQGSESQTQGSMTQLASAMIS